ncbi:hypothetical protein DAEQUDRAFT_664360, partial [Daedalea quercina L-15889]
YYFNDGNVIFLVEDTLFNVHRYFFERDSPVFRAMFACPSETPEGGSEDNPILLEGVKSAGFASFLSCLYPMRFGTGDLTTFQDWSNALDLALRWEFDPLREFIALRIEETCNVIEHIVTARRLDKQDWCFSACAKLCHRSEPLTLEEAQILGIVETVRICAVREMCRGKPVRDLLWDERPWSRPREVTPGLEIKYHKEHAKKLLELPNAT